MDTIRPEQLHTKTETIDSTMFPVWFLSYRKKDRVAYATVNGQTGLVVADIPIDPKRYLLGSLLLAIPIFALLAWSAFLQPSSLVMTTLLLSLLSIGVYCYECVSIHQMAAILVSFISIIHAYNLLSTRRLPQFDKQGGDDRA